MEIFFLAWKWKLRLSKLIEKSSKEIIYLRNQSCKCHRYGRYTCVKNMKFWVKMWENTQFCWTKKFWVNSNNKFEVLSSNQPHMIYDVALQAFDHQRLPFQTILFNLSTKFVAICAFFSLKNVSTKTQSRKVENWATRKCEDLCVCTAQHTRKSDPQPTKQSLLNILLPSHLSSNLLSVQ